MASQVDHERIRATATDSWAKATAAIKKLAAYDDVSALPTIVQKIVARAPLHVGALVEKYEASMRDIEAIASEKAITREIRKKYYDLDRDYGGTKYEHFMNLMTTEIMARDKLNAELCHGIYNRSRAATDGCHVFAAAVDEIDVIVDLLRSRTRIMSGAPICIVMAVNNIEAICDSLRRVNNAFDVPDMDTYVVALLREFHDAIGADTPNAAVMSVRDKFSPQRISFGFVSQIVSVDIPAEYIPHTRVMYEAYHRDRVYKIFNKIENDFVPDNISGTIEPMLTGLFAHGYDYTLRVSVIGYNTAKAQ